ncbi:hypothetical protein H2198_003051 [Neophaeococcomyces mojaviensis]|uniref:Uncharacterized protein n=1 Tax=Neophaeococcomyces mojaviensis TaxID=3383035 RepID=A0ACC3ACL7_9EURO|nr:hypothetical protein H2198_003051 [Knufia sp. JES_112]
MAVNDQVFKLLDLPPELLAQVVFNLDIKSAKQVRLTCSLLKEFAEPRLFERFRILHGIKAEELACLLARDSRRAAFLRSVLVSTKYGEDKGLETFPLDLRKMHNLEELILETPDCNSKQPEDRISWIRLQKGYEDIFRQSSVAIPQAQRILPCLETCTMHFVDEVVSLYPLTKYSSIFLHPTLKSLTLSCACTDKPERILADYRQYKHTTALEHLHLEECDIEPDSLEILLKFPKELKSLKLSEGIRYDDSLATRRSRMHGNVNPSLLSRAITQATGNSLESLSLALGYQERNDRTILRPGRFLDFTNMSALKTLGISISTSRLIFPRHQCDHSTYRRLPPSLETLRVFSIPLLTPFMNRRRPHIPFQTCLIKEKAAHGAPNLKHVIWAYEYQAPGSRSQFGLARRRGPDVIERMISASKEYIVDLCNKNYHIYQSHDVRLSVECDITPRGFIPPYLYPEDKPTTEPLWDSLQPPLEAQIYMHRAQRAARAALMGSHATNVEVAGSIGGSIASVATQTNDDDSGEEDDEDGDDDDDDDENMQLPPQAQELFELLMMQAAPPLQP